MTFNKLKKKNYHENNTKQNIKTKISTFSFKKILKTLYYSQVKFQQSSKLSKSPI